MFASRYYRILSLAMYHGVTYNMGINNVTTISKKHVIMTWVSNPNFGVANQ